MSELKMVGLSDPGRVRNENEDRITTHPNLGIAVLADGMGGHQAGEVASGMAVDVITRHFTEVLGKVRKTRRPTSTSQSPEARLVNEAIQLANSAIYEVARMRKDYAGMGSTIVVTMFYGDTLCVGHVGDSRLYRYRDDTLEQLTEDHSVVQELVNRGLATPEEAATVIGKNLVTRALGVDPIVVPDIREQKFHESDLYMLCSDGLNDVIEDDDIASILAGGGQRLDQTTRLLIETANERGGPDNVSVILVRTGDQFTREFQAS
jgi:protein phosphatase